MTLRDLAARVLLSADVSLKLRPVAGELPDDDRGSPVRVSEPARPAGLRFVYKRNGPALPRGAALEDRGRRGVAHHILANHELQAAEVMASVLLAFPNAPASSGGNSATSCGTNCGTPGCTWRGRRRAACGSATAR